MSAPESPLKRSRTEDPEEPHVHLVISGATFHAFDSYEAAMQLVGDYVDRLPEASLERAVAIKLFQQDRTKSSGEPTVMSALSARGVMYKKIPIQSLEDLTYPASCGCCTYKGNEEKERCFVCSKPLCKAQKIAFNGTVCSACEGAAERDGMTSVYVDGKNDEGQWIDPGNKVALPTCEICGFIRHDFRCGRLMLATGNPCSRTGKTLAQWKEEATK